MRLLLPVCLGTLHRECLFRIYLKFGRKCSESNRYVGMSCTEGYDCFHKPFELREAGSAAEEFDALSLIHI